MNNPLIIEKDASHVDHSNDGDYLVQPKEFINPDSTKRTEWRAYNGEITFNSYIRTEKDGRTYYIRADYFVRICLGMIPGLDPTPEMFEAYEILKERYPFF